MRSRQTRSKGRGGCKVDLIKQTTHLPATIEELNTFILIGKEKLKAHQAKINAIKKVGMAKSAWKVALQDGQDMGMAVIHAEAKLGQLLKPLANPTSSRRGTRQLPEGINKKTSHRAQTIFDNPDAIEGVRCAAVITNSLPTSDKVYKLAKEKERMSRVDEEKTKRLNELSDIEIRKGDFKDVLDDVYNIDAIITDPPYPKEYIQCFSELSKYASEHLKEDGFCIAYSGQYNLPEVIARMSEHLTYVWTFCLYHVGKKQLVNGVNIMCGWKPVLVFSRGRKKMRYSAYDVLISEASEKHSHEWQQSESGVAGLIEIFTEPGQLVVDPFAGSGTFPKVAHDMGRNAIGAQDE